MYENTSVSTLLVVAPSHKKQQLPSICIDANPQRHGGLATAARIKGSPFLEVVTLK
jgi:hypothetical protein